MEELREPVAGKASEPCRFIEISGYPVGGVKEYLVLLLPQKMRRISRSVECSQYDAECGQDAAIAYGGLAGHLRNGLLDFGRHALIRQNCVDSLAAI